jgi:SAM-dependent methyltransferase
MRAFGSTDDIAKARPVADNLIEDQYRDSAKLSARMALHAKYGPSHSLASVPSVVTPAAGAKVLEVGCGPGRFWQAAGAWPADLVITLTDLSPGMAEEALATVRGFGRWADVVSQVADVCALPFADASFDIVLAMHMLYHAPDPDLAVREIARVLRPGGVAVASTNSETNMAALFELGHAALGGERLDLAATAFSLESGPAILRRHFGAVETHRAVAVLRVTDPADIVAYLTSFSPGDRATPAMLARLDAMTADAFAADGGVFEITRDTGFLVARKTEAVLNAG